RLAVAGSRCPVHGIGLLSQALSPAALLRAVLPAFVRLRRHLLRLHPRDRQPGTRLPHAHTRGPRQMTCLVAALQESGSEWIRHPASGPVTIKDEVLARCSFPVCTMLSPMHWFQLAVVTAALLTAVPPRA